MQQLKHSGVWCNHQLFMFANFSYVTNINESVKRLYDFSLFCVTVKLSVSIELLANMTVAAVGLL